LTSTVRSNKPLKESGYNQKARYQRIKERITLNIKAVGTINLDGVYAVAPPEPGKKIA
jgi:hypothetical protein